MQSFTYDALNRLTTASTDGVGEGQYSQSYGYDPATGNLASKSDVGAYSYSPAKPHAVVQAGANSYAYDQNGNMTSRTVDGVVWTYAYNAENQLITTHKSNQLISEYGYDGDGKRVWAKDYEGYLPDNPRLTVYIGNYYEARVEGYRPPTGGDPVQPCIAPSFCVYFPLVVKSAVENVSYYYADGQRIAMKKDGVVYYLYGDQLGSVSAVADGSGALINRSLYEPWGVARYQIGSNITDYAYTGQMQEGDIYFYQARWYDPQLGRFMQADTLVPSHQGTQGFDRYAYINNNPVNGTDPSGNWLIPGWDDTYILNQGQTNRCAVFSLAMAVSAVSEMQVDEAKLEQAWIWQKLGLDWGIPPILQPGGVNNTFPDVEAEYLQGDKEKIINFLEQGNPVVVTLAYPKYGHSVVAIGYEPLSDELIFVNPAGGNRRNESELVNEIRSQIKYYYPNTDLTQYEDFAALQSHSNFWILSGSLVVLSKHEQSGVLSYVPTYSLRGRNSFGPVLMPR